MVDASAEVTWSAARASVIAEMGERMVTIGGTDDSDEGWEFLTLDLPHTL